MTTDTQEQPNQEVQESQPAIEPTSKPEEKSVEELQRENEEIRRLAEKKKEEVSGLDRKVSDLTNQLKSIKEEQERERLSKMNEDERRQEELRKIEEEKRRFEEEKNSYNRKRLIESKLIESGLPIDFVNSISGDDEQSITDSIKGLKELINNKVKSETEAEINKRFGNKPPVSSTVENDESLQSMYNKAKEDKNTGLMMKIKLQASRQGEQIKE